MSELDDDFDLELDAETLRQIEEEARRKVEAEMLDENILRDIQAEALADEGLDDVEIDAEMMREIEEEARRLLAEEGYDVDGVEVDDDDDDDDEFALPPELEPLPSGPKIATAVRQASPPEAAALPPKPKLHPPAPTGDDDAADEAELPSAAVKDSTARRSAVERARERAEDKVRKKTRTRMKQSAKVKLKNSHAHRRGVSEITTPPKPADNKKMMMFVVGAFVLIIVIAIIVALVTKNPAASPQTAPAAGGQAPTEAPLSEGQRTRIAWDDMQKEIKEIVKKGQTAANLQKVIDMLEAFKAEHPDYTETCDKQIKRYRGTLNFIKGGG